MTPEQITNILDAHKKWLLGEEGGARADLTDANLTDANLTDADLTGAYLTDADLTGAYLTRADLTRAYLTGADLTDANLTGAYLTGADLTDANLTGAYLTRADLTRADLTRAYLTGADLTLIRDDLFEVLKTVPSEVPGLLKTLREGRVDGSTYEGECACLVGTVANLKQCNYGAIKGLTPDSSRPIERWFLALRPGQKPDNCPVAAITEKWIVEWMAANPVPVPVETAQ